MKTVEATRLVDAPYQEVVSSLSPEMIILHEGTFTVSDIEETEDGLIVEAKATGITARFRFERLQAGFYYEQIGSEGPFESLQTTISYHASDGGTELTMTSDVSLGLRPRRLMDRIAAWKRKGELHRALRSIANEFE